VRIDSENDPFWPIADMKFRATTLSALNELIEIQLFARCCAARRDGEKSRKSGRPNGRGNERGLTPSESIASK
jgi:hypothetical protein